MPCLRTPGALTSRASVRRRLARAPTLCRAIASSRSTHCELSVRRRPRRCSTAACDQATSAGEIEHALGVPRPALALVDARSGPRIPAPWPRGPWQVGEGLSHAPVAGLDGAARRGRRRCWPPKFQPSAKQFRAVAAPMRPIWSIRFSKSTRRSEDRELPRTSAARARDLRSQRRRAIRRGNGRVRHPCRSHGAMAAPHEEACETATATRRLVAAAGVVVTRGDLSARQA